MFKRINSIDEQTVTITIEDADRCGCHEHPRTRLPGGKKPGAAISGNVGYFRIRPPIKPITVEQLSN